jgi:hypothetical protein
MRSRITGKLSRRQLGVLLEAILVGAILVLVTKIAMDTSPAKASPTAQVDERTLQAKAIGEAQKAGLQGMPTAHNAIQVNLAEWFRRTNAELREGSAQFGLTPDMPVFVLAMRGHVEWQAAGLPRPGHPYPEHYDNIIVALNARNGELVWIGSYQPGSPMPVSIP